MKGDFSRSTFSSEKHYSGVRMQQGRVQLDADWNEQIDITAYRTETEAIDVIGGCGAPKNDPGFEVTIDDDGMPIIGRVRYYVDGILCENDPEPGEKKEDKGKKGVRLDQQPDLPVADLKGLITPISDTVQLGGYYIAYLDVWQRHITALEDEHIREVALGGPDTATRTKTVWQVKLLGPFGQALPCTSELQEWNDLVARTQDGRLSARAEESDSSRGTCDLPAAAGYRRLGNQLYRVEIHEVDKDHAITKLKWSRDNGSVVTRWQKQGKSSELEVSSIGRDEVLRFGPDQYIEVIDDQRELRGEAGILVKLAKAESNVLTLAEDDPNLLQVQKTRFPDLIDGRPNNPKVRRWDGVLGETELSQWRELEYGVQIRIDGGKYHIGDYWLIPARTATGSVEWPRDTAAEPVPQGRSGIEHHYCKLAILQGTVEASGELKFSPPWQDCRVLFRPLTEQVTLLYAGGDGQEARPGESLPQPLRVRVIRGGVRMPVNGAAVLFTVIDGGGHFGKIPAAPEKVGTTAPDGIAECAWTLGQEGKQQVKAVLLGVDDKPVPGQILYFSANLSGASPDEDGIHIEEVKVGNQELLNDSFIVPSDLREGISIRLDKELFGRSVAHDNQGSPNPVCTVTLELPWPTEPDERRFWELDDATILGFQPITLAATVNTGNFNIGWHPRARAVEWVNTLLGRLSELGINGILLARLKLRGNFIWGPKEEPELYLDGEAFGRWHTEGNNVDVQLPSGNRRRGGDFEMWFWLKLGD